MSTSVYVMEPRERVQACQAQRAQGYGRRIYDVTATHADGDVLQGDDAWITDERIGQLVRSVFRLLFGAAPQHCWHKDGWMAEAWDDQGRRVSVDQVNDR